MTIATRNARLWPKGGDAPFADPMAVTPRVSLSPVSVGGPFSLLWPPQPCFQKRQESFAAVRTDKRGKSPTSMPLAGCLATSQPPNSRLGQIPHNPCGINGVGRLKFQRGALKRTSLFISAGNLVQKN